MKKASSICIICGCIFLFYYLTGFVLILYGLFLRSKANIAIGYIKFKKSKPRPGKNLLDTNIGQTNVSMNQYMGMQQISQPIIRHCKKCGSPRSVYASACRCSFKIY